MGSLTADRPKCLLSVAGRTLLERTLTIAEDAGLSEIVIVTGYLRTQLEEFVRHRRSRARIFLVHNESFATTTNAHSLWLAGSRVRNRPVILLDADILFAEEIFHALLRAPRENTLVVRASEALGEEEVKVLVDPANRVMRIGKDVDPRLASGESIGLEKFSGEGTNAILDALDGGLRHAAFYEAAFEHAISRGLEMYALDSGRLPCIEIDTPEDLAAAENLARRYGL